MTAKPHVRAIVPSFTYDDAPAAIEFLCNAFGFEKKAVKTPRALGGVTGGTYIVLERDEDVDAHCTRAREAGAKIVREPESPEYGGRNYSAADPEGYLWSFGSYRPEGTS